MSGEGMAIRSSDWDTFRDAVVNDPLRAADEIDVLRGALRDALALLPPDRWKLLLPRYADVRVSVLDPESNGSSPDTGTETQ